MSNNAFPVSVSANQASAASIGAIVAETQLWTRLVRALESGGLELCSCARGADALTRAAPNLDIVILYAGGNRCALFDAIRTAKNALPTAALIVIWPAGNASDSRGALRAGADGVVSEAELETTLAATVVAVRSGLVCVPRPMRALLESESLSIREKQVLGMLVMGFTNAEIAAKLFLAESTVKSHLSSAYAKLGVRSRKDAATLILDPIEGLGPGILAISAA